MKGDFSKFLPHAARNPGMTMTQFLKFQQGNWQLVSPITKDRTLGFKFWFSEFFETRWVEEHHLH